MLGYLPQDFGVYPNLTARGIPRIHGGDQRPGRRSRPAGASTSCSQLVNLVDAAKRPLGGYSGGMKQRVGIAQALLNDPQLLIVDEPTVGLDPEERVRFRNLLSDLSGERIILLSTHIVSDVEATATEIVLINQGRLLARAAPEDLLPGWTAGSGLEPPRPSRSNAQAAAPGHRHPAPCGGMLVRVVSQSSPSPCGAARRAQPGRCLPVPRRSQWEDDSRMTIRQTLPAPRAWFTTSPWPISASAPAATAS